MTYVRGRFCPVHDRDSRSLNAAVNRYVMFCIAKSLIDLLAAFNNQPCSTASDFLECRHG